MSDESPAAISRRDFIRIMGQSIFALTILSQLTPALGGSCGHCDGEPECDQPGESDGTCGSIFCLGGDSDGGCGNGEKDNHCGSNDVDENCSPPCSDSSYDVDNDCGGTDKTSDSSCGDCDDSHETDDNCPNDLVEDPDDLCGHPHNYGGDEDDHCDAAGEEDSYCGTYDMCYQVPLYDWTDHDQGCCESDASHEPDNSNNTRPIGGCSEDHAAPEWHYSGD